MEQVQKLVASTVATFQAQLAVLLPAVLADQLGNRARTEPSVTLWASEIGSYINQDAWMSRDRALAKVWRRTNDSHFLDVQSLWRAHGCRFPTSADDYVSSQLMDPFSHLQTVEDIENFRKIATPADIIKMYRTKGVLKEEAVAAMFSESIQQPVMLRHAAVEWRSATQTSHDMLPLTTVRAPGPVDDPGHYTLVGQVDGWLTSHPYAGTVVEIKVRMDHIPPFPPDRDVMQVQAYMHINNAEECIYVQNLFGTRVLQTMHFYRDRKYWDCVIKPGLDAFVCDIRRLLRGSPEDVVLRHRVLAAAEKDHIPSKPIPPPPEVAAAEVLPQQPAKKKKVSIPAAPAKPLPPIEPARPPSPIWTDDRVETPPPPPTRPSRRAGIRKEAPPVTTRSQKRQRH